MVGTTSIPIRIASAGSRIRYFVEALLAIILLTIPSWTRAGVKTAASTGFNDVAATVSSAKDGDTVVLPAGTTSWTSTLTIKKAITLQGAGVGQTIIKDDLLTKNAHLISITTSAGKCYRLTGLEFQPGTRTTVFTSGMISVTGNSTSFRIDNCKFDILNNVPYFYFAGAVCGVVDHCTFIRGASQGGGCFKFYHDAWDKKKWGDGSWANPVDWGGPNAIYIEDCTFTNVLTSATRGISDAHGGARWVFRHNTCTNIKVEVNHGTESTGRMRGGRSVEIYDNTFTGTHPASNLFNQRSGTGVCFNNISTGYSHSAWYTATNYRDDGYYSFNRYPGWQGANGLSGWDINDTTGGPNHDGVYLTGTASGGSGTGILNVSGANWTPNQWKSYVVRNTDAGYTDGNGVTWSDYFATIASNTTDTITVDAGAFKILSFNPGDHFEIRKVIQALDTIGASTGDLLSGGKPSPTNLHQTMEPIYCWNNTVDGVPATVVGTTSNVVEGVNYINGTAKPGYTPYVYPHPLVTGVPSPPKTLKPAAPKSQGRRQNVR